MATRVTTSRRCTSGIIWTGGRRSFLKRGEGDEMFPLNLLFHPGQTWKTIEEAIAEVVALRMANDPLRTERSQGGFLQRPGRLPLIAIHDLRRRMAMAAP